MSDIDPTVKRRQVPIHRELTRAHARQAVAEAPYIAHGLAVLALLAVANAVVFSLLGYNYFSWWLSNGALLSILFVLLSAAANLDGHPELIAQHPWAFVVGAVKVVMEINAAWQATAAPTAPDSELERSTAWAFVSPFRWRTLDTLLTVIFWLGFGAVVILWLVVVTPLQFVTNLICGAPARQALTSSETHWIKNPSHGGASADAGPAQETDEGGEGTKEERQTISYVRAPRDYVPEPGMRQVTLAARPVSFTAALAAALLFGLDALNLV